MKIAIVGPFFLPQLFGIEKVMLSHARHLADRGHEVHVITSAQQFPTGKFEGLSAEERMDGFTIHRVRVLVRSPSRYFYYLANSGLLLSGLAETLERLSPDIVHIHNVASPMWAYTAARYTDRHKKKLFYSLHYHPDGLGMSKWHTLIVHMLNRLPMKRARRLYHLTRIDFDLFAREYRNTDRSLFFALPNGVNPPLAVRSAGRNNDELKLLFVGRVEDVRKGFDILELAYARVRQSNWTLTVIGRISQEKRSALEAKFGSAIRVLGDVDEETLEHEYAESDLFVMPSRYEGFGMPYIEAMRYETPVIGTTAGGIPEVVPEGTGILVAPEDEDALAEAMTYLGTSSALRKAFGAEGKLWADRFQWRFIIDQLESDYNEA